MSLLEGDPMPHMVPNAPPNLEPAPNPDARPNPEAAPNPDALGPPPVTVATDASLNPDHAPNPDTPPNPELVPTPGAPPNPEASLPPTPTPNAPPNPEAANPDAPLNPEPAPNPDTPPNPEPAPVLQIVTTTKEKPRCRSKGEDKKRPGKLLWVHGTKRAFLERRKADWLREAEAKQADNPPDSAADAVVHEVLSDEEVAFRSTYMQTLRTRISQWYRTEYGSLLKSDASAFKDLFTGVLDGTCGGADGVITKVTAEIWEGETPEFKHECQVMLNREHELAIHAWELSLADSPTRTAEEIAVTLENAAFYLQPFANAIRERFGITTYGDVLAYTRE
ncbi:hypothetical protein K438DRAFT_1996518 [Mycena galopus ATCC 62051]|nr:hypothetical protein K438DRAFT_1996518 [Mycena galopus ATCC 62051]